MPIAADGVWVYQFGVVTEDERIVNGFVLGERTLQSGCLRIAIDWYGRVLLDDNAGACVKVSFLREVVIARALLDTEASVKIMTEGLWEKLGTPALLEAPPMLFAANRSQIELIGKSSPLTTTMGIKDEMYVSYVIIPTKDKDQIILGTEFMRPCPTRIHLPDGGSPSLDVMQIDEAGEPTPVTLKELMAKALPKPKPRAVTFATQPEVEVLEVTEGDCD